MTSTARIDATPEPQGVQYAVLAFFAETRDGIDSAVAAVSTWTAPVAPGRAARAYALRPTTAPVGDSRPRNLYGLADSPPTLLVEVSLDHLPDRLPAGAPDGACAVTAIERIVHAGPAQPDASVQRLGLTRRREELDLDQFARAWRERHVPLVLSAGPRFTRYSTGVVRRGDVPWHGIAAQSFSSPQAAAEHDHNNKVVHPEVFADAGRIVAAAEQYWATPASSDPPNPNPDS